MHFCILILALCFSTFAQASDREEIQACLEHWSEHPFKGENPKFRTLTTRVKVMGIGDEIADQTKTEKPELVLVKPNVTVLSKSVLRLLNPNGWYCLKGKVAVLGKSEIEVHCQSKLASSSSGAVVLGSDKENTGGVTVLGETSVRRIGCKE